VRQLATWQQIDHAIRALNRRWQLLRIQEPSSVVAAQGVRVALARSPALVVRTAA
jgi:hypothetical protein